MQVFYLVAAVGGGVEGHVSSVYVEVINCGDHGLPHWRPVVVSTQFLLNELVLLLRHPLLAETVGNPLYCVALADKCLR